MVTVTINEWLNNKDHNFCMEIDMCDSAETFNISDMYNGWYSMEDLNQLIKALQKAKRIYKTRIIKPND